MTGCSPKPRPLYLGTSRAHGTLDWHLPRCLALLGGTTGWPECVEALRHLLTPTQLVQGAKVDAYERAFARTVGVKHAISFASGRVGLYGLLQVLGVGEGAEVLLSVPTHVVVANAIRYTGARPVYVDCSLQNYNIDFESAESRITPRSRILLLQHTFGIPVELDTALAFARRHNLVVIEDCVHALGARYDGRPVGTFGHAAFFSTEETKTISTVMGGMVVTNDPELASHMRGFQASCTRPRRWLAARHLLKFVLYYILTEPPFVRYPIWVDDRPSVIRALTPRAVIGTWFTSVLEEAESLDVAGYEPGSCPHAEQAAQHLINLPTHRRVSERDTRILTTALLQAVSSSNVP